MATRGATRCKGAPRVESDMRCGSFPSLMCASRFQFLILFCVRRAPVADARDALLLQAS